MKNSVPSRGHSGNYQMIPLSKTKSRSGYPIRYNPKGTIEPYYRWFAQDAKRQQTTKENTDT